MHKNVCLFLILETGKTKDDNVTKLTKYIKPQFQEEQY